MKLIFLIVTICLFFCTEARSKPEHDLTRQLEDNDRTARYIAYVKTPYRTTFVAGRPRPVPYRYGRDVEEMLTKGPDGLIKEKRFVAASKKPFATTVVTGNHRNVRSAEDTDRTARYVAYSSTPYKKVLVVTRPYKYGRAAGRAYVFGRDAEEMLTRGPDGLIKEKRFVVASKKPFTTTVVTGKPYRG